MPLSVSSNVVTLLLIGHYRDVWTTTNLYLGSLALMGLPFDLSRLWRSRSWVFGPLLCCLSLYLGEGCIYATLLHKTSLSSTWQSGARCERRSLSSSALSAHSLPRLWRYS